MKVVSAVLMPAPLVKHHRGLIAKWWMLLFRGCFLNRSKKIPGRMFLHPQRKVYLSYSPWIKLPHLSFKKNLSDVSRFMLALSNWVKIKWSFWKRELLTNYATEIFFKKVPIKNMLQALIADSDPRGRGLETPPPPPVKFLHHKKFL